MPVAQPRPCAGVDEVPARTEPEATSPETDTPSRLFAEICYLLYQEPGCRK